MADKPRRGEHAKPAYALAGLVGLQYGIGTMVSHGTATWVVLLAVAAAVWVVVVVAHVFHLPVAFSWRYFVARRQLRRQLSRYERS